ncbi:DinB family protein [Urechidicola croceus]|uniref:Damage-inducible protein DinB n=1 Tax=Urechidicola croceus TaxID=1850246 RepID=A0A1D8P9Y0_9FLAO|nr:DinB family protein [Urechidicola croceus]AOW21387.1 damage-inducible protein DinB [Urechidicola croceus]
MKEQFDIINKGRILMLKLIEGYSIEQLNKIPKGFSNNIVWNIAHLVVTQQLLCYKFSGLKPLISEDMIETFRKGTSPQKDISAEYFEEIKRLFLELPIQFEEDYSKGIFINYTEYTTSVNVTLTDINKAFYFNNFHEGIHLGSILALRKFI